MGTNTMLFYQQMGFHGIGACVTHLCHIAFMSYETVVQECDASTAKLLSGCRANIF